MSADGEGIIGAAVLAFTAAPVLIAGATVAGAIYGTTKLIEHTSNNRQKSEAIRKERERKKAAELARKTEEERRKINEIRSSFNVLQSKQADTRKALNQKFSSDFALAVNEMEKNQQLANLNLIELVKKFEEQNRKIFSEWQRSSEQLQLAYSSSVAKAMSNMKQTVEQSKKQFDSIQKQMQDDDHIKEEYAKDQIEKAKAAIDTLQVEADTFNNALINNLNRAIDYYNQKMYDNAYSVASSVVMDCYDEISNSLVIKEKIYTLIDSLETKIILEKSRIDSFRHFTFNYKDESYEEDLTRFSSELFSAIYDRLSGIESQLSVSDLSTLISISHELDEIEVDINEVTKLSATRLLYAYTENDTASDITSAMKTQGFDMEGYAYENDVEGNSIHINYCNCISNEKVTVVLNPTQDGIKVKVHNFGTRSISGQEDATRQDSIRQLIENTLNIRISCMNRGKSSINTSAANLSDVKRLS